jgi:hypothetical protein
MTRQQRRKRNPDYVEKAHVVVFVDIVPALYPESVKLRWGDE